MKKGETLLEAVVAIAVLLIALSFTASSFSGALRGLSFSRNEATAGFLAREGKEAVENILLSNRLRFHENIDSCWNAGWISNMPVENAEDCPANPIGFTDGWTMAQNARDNPSIYNSSLQYFRLQFFRQTGRFQLVPLNVQVGEALFDYDENGKLSLHLSQVDCDPAPSPCVKRGVSAEPYGLSKTDEGFYEYVKDDPAPSFYRAIAIVYFNSVPLDRDGNPEPLADSMKVVSFVAFTEGGEWKFTSESL